MDGERNMTTLIDVTPEPEMAIEVKAIKSDGREFMCSKGIESEGEYGEAAAALSEGACPAFLDGLLGQGGAVRMSLRDRPAHRTLAECLGVIGKRLGRDGE